MIYKYVLILKDLENVKEHRRKRRSPFPPLLSVCCGFFRPSTDLCFLVCLEIEHFLNLCLNLCNHATCFYNFPPHSVCLRGLSMSVHIELSLYSHCCTGLCGRFSPSSSTGFYWICFPHVCRHCVLSFFFFYSIRLEEF